MIDPATDHSMNLEKPSSLTDMSIVVCIKEKTLVQDTIGKNKQGRGHINSVISVKLTDVIIFMGDQKTLSSILLEW